MPKQRYIIIILISLVVLTVPSLSEPNYQLYPTDYRWLEIADFGEAVELPVDNDFAGPFDIGFEFPFYGRTYREFFIGSNGFLGFGPPTDYSSQDDRAFPGRTAPHNLIAVYWKDLDPTAFWANPAIYYGIRDYRLVVQFQNYPEHNENGRAPDNAITMQVVLEQDGDIILQYSSIGDQFDLSDGAIGMENADGSAGLTVRQNGEGAGLAEGAAFRISEAGSETALVWDAGSATASGEAQETALEALGFEVAHLTANQELPADLVDYDAVFVNLGSYGANGDHYHHLTEQEGNILAAYLAGGGALYLEGGDVWYGDPAVEVHRYFHIRGLRDGGVLEPPVVGLRGSLAEGLRFTDYRSEDNRYIDQLAPREGAQPVFSFVSDGRTAVGMVSYIGDNWKTVGSSFELGALVDGDDGRKLALIARLVRFFRTPPPEFPPPTNLRGEPDDAQVTLRWDLVESGQLTPRQELEMEREINQLTLARDGRKPVADALERAVELKRELDPRDDGACEQPDRDEFHQFNIQVDGGLYDQTNARSYTVLELRNGQAYQFAVSSVYEDPDGESEIAGPITVIPVAMLSPPTANDFERDNGGLYSDPPTEAWEWGEPAVGAASGQMAWGTGLNGGYPDNAVFYLYTPTIDLHNLNLAWLRFKHYLNVEPGWDGGRVEASSDGGIRWALLTPLGGYPDSTVFAFDGSPAYTGDTHGWTDAVCDLSGFTGQKVRVRFVFRSDESNFRQWEGWFIDDLAVVIPELGDVEVRVTRSDGGGIENARVTIDDTLFTVTDLNGRALFSRLIAGEHTITASRLGYITVSIVRAVEANQLNSYEITLDEWDSDLSLNADTVDVELPFEGTAAESVTMSNLGGMETDFQLFINRYPGEPDLQTGAGYPNHAEPWELLQTYDLTAATGGQYFTSAEFIVDGHPLTYKLVAGAGNFEQAACSFYQLDRAGSFIRSYAQAGNNRGLITDWGVRDLAYDGTYIYGSIDNRILEFDPDNGNFVRALDGPSSPLPLNRAIAYVPGEDAFWVGDWDDSWYKLSRQGEILDIVRDHGLSGVAGMAWNPDDPDGACLYIHNQEGLGGGSAVYRFNPETRELTRTLQTCEEGEGTAGGAFITDLYDTHQWTLGVLIQEADRDAIKLYALHPKQSWLTVSPDYGRLEAGGAVDLTINFDASYWLDTTFAAVIEVHDLRTGLRIDLPCSLDVNDGWGAIEGTMNTDREGVDVTPALVTLGDRTVNPDADGLFRFDRLFPSDPDRERVYRLSAHLDSFQVYLSDPVQVIVGNITIQNIHLIHSLVGTLAGRITSRDDSPISEAEVVALDGDGTFTSGVSDVDGIYSFDLPAGLFRVQVLKDSFRTAPREDVEIRDGEITQLDFTMDDRLAVKGLLADGNYDDRIQLYWLRPGTLGEAVPLQYDDGFRANGLTLNSYDDILAIRFDPGGTYDISTVSIYVATNFDLSDWGLPHYQDDPIEVVIISEDPENGLPDEVVYEEYVDRHRNPNNRGWVTLYPQNLRFRDGAFYVGWHRDPMADNGAYIGLDETSEHADNVYLRVDRQWGNYDRLPGDPLIRAVCWKYFEDDGGGRDSGAMRRLRPTDSSPGITDGLLGFANPATSGKAIADPVIDWQLVYDRIERPKRDEFLAYRVYADGEMVADNVQDEEYLHIVDSDSENQDITFSVSALYQEEEIEEIAGPETVARFNMAPDSVRAASVVSQGLQYTISWQRPLSNTDGSECVDYNGCELFLNHELIADVEPDVFSYQSGIAAGEEGWYQIELVAKDEVPNRATPVVLTKPLGNAVVYNFEQAQAVFQADPLGKWARSRQLLRGPRTAHSENWAWGTLPNTDNYEDNADWKLTTQAEYLVESAAARCDFYQWLDSESGHDGGQLLVAVDGGDWQLLEPTGSYPDPAVAGLMNSPGYSGDINEWTLASFDLSQFQGHCVKLRWRFGTDRTINHFYGWFIDDLVLWSCSRMQPARVSGRITDQFGAALAGVTVRGGRSTAVSVANGNYLLTNLLPGETLITVSYQGYQGDDSLLALAQNDNLSLDFILWRPQLEPQPDEFLFTLGAGDQGETSLSLTNRGDFTVPFSVEVRSVFHQLHDRHAPRWDDSGDTAFDYDLTALTGYRRIIGAEFVEGRFYLTCADPDSGNLVLVLSRDGQLENVFRQPFAPVGWGLRDLAWDGEYLNGSQDDKIYTFSLQGDSIDVFSGAPLTINRALTYAPEVGGFWTGEWDSPWYLIDREGSLLAKWEGHNLSGVYGFAWFTDDPDGYPLYVFNREDDDSTAIYRADPDGRQLELLYQLPLPPGGCFITGDWDLNRWIIGGVVGDDNQHLVGIELQEHSAWLKVSPSEGELTPQSSAQMQLDFAMPDEAVDGDTLAADIAILAFGGIQTVVPVQVAVSDAFAHFPAPQPNNETMAIRVESARRAGMDFPFNSEIAVLTPDGEVGGVTRWLGLPVDFTAYGGDGAFQLADRISFLIWDAADNMEYNVDTTIVDGRALFLDGEQLVVRLDAIITTTQEVVLNEEGWNLISISVELPDLSMEAILDRLIENEHLFMVKDRDGRLFIPARGFNQIGDWNLLAGYQVYMTAPDTLRVTGIRVPYDTPIPLDAGWNLISYLPEEALHIRTALANIWDDIIIVKDNWGRFVVPEFDYYDFVWMNPGEGYIIKVRESIQLVYNLEGELAVVGEGASLEHQPLRSTGRDMSLLVTQVNDAPDGAVLEVTVGDVLLDRRPVGNTPIGVIIRGDDSLTPEPDGACDGDSIRFVFVDGDGSIRAPAVRLISGCLTYHDDEFTVVTLNAVNVPPSEFTLSGVHPNPFNGFADIRFGVPKAILVSLACCDITGRVVFETGNRAYSAGWHTYRLNAATWASGIYFLTIETAQSSTAVKMVLVR